MSMKPTSFSNNRFSLICRSLVLLLVLAIFNLTFCHSALAQETGLRTLTVTGQGVDILTTKLTQVQLGVEIRGKTATAVQQEVARRTSALVNLLRSRDVEQLQTTGISLRPDYDFSNNQRRLIGYLGINTVSFRLKTEKVGALLDKAVSAGATRIDKVSFTATESAIAAGQKKALAEATQDALEQADVILRSLNLTRKDIVNIQVNEAKLPQPRTISTAEMSRAVDSRTPVIGGEQRVRAFVTLQISY